MTENAGIEDDPFSPEMAPAVSLIVSLRIYDVLMAILTKMDAKAAADLYALHNDGKVIGSLPWLDMSDGEA